MTAFFQYALAPRATLTKRRLSALENLINKCVENDFDEGRFPDDIVECRKQMKHVVAELIDFDERMDVSILNMASLPCDYHISGGRTSGDPPTEAYELLTYVEGCAPVWKQIEQWAKADKQKALSKRKRLTKQRRLLCHS